MHENEVLVLLLGTVVLGFIFLFRLQLMSLPSVKWLFASYCAAWVAWVATVVEHLAFPALFHVLEHMAYALNGLLLMAWCWIGLRQVPVSQDG